MSDTDFSALIEPVCRYFWGDPNPKLSTKTELRWGSQGSRSVELNGDGFWKDFESGEGGGVIKLVMHERKCPQRDAIEWLEAQNFIPKRDSGHSEAPQRQESPRPSNEPQREDKPATQARGKWTIVEVDAYHTRDGELSYEVCRIQWKLPDGSWELGKKGKPKKTFVQRRPSGRPDGSKAWGLSEGEYMRSAPGRDWKPFHEAVFDEWPQGERGLWLPEVQHTIFHHQELELAIEAGKTILLPEGERKVKVAELLGFGGSTNSGGAANWNDRFAEYFRGADVVIPIDNDEAGREAGEKKAASLRGKAARVRLLDFAALDPTFKPGFDIVDWHAAGGTAEQLSEIIGRLPDWKPRPPQSKFGALAVKEAVRYASVHEWLVDDLIELHGTASFSGNSQSGKTFQVIELAFCVATGRPYWGRAVKQGLVIYQVGEGEEGFMKRLAGYMNDRGIDDISDLPILILPKKINLFQSEDDTTNLIAEAKAWAEYYGIPLRMIVIDTYNKATRGANEISGQDIGRINERLERIQTECKCNVTVVDHLSKGGTVRGHGSKTGDITNMIIVEKDEKKVDRNGRPVRRMRLDKNKDGENGGTIEFVLRQVVVGFKDDGKAITTCVVEAPHGNEEELERSGRLPLNQSIILQTIRDVIAREGYPAPPDMPEEVRRPVVAWKTVMAELRRKWLYKAPETEPEQREHELHRIVTDAGRKLQNNGYIDRDNTKGIVWWTGKTDRPLFKPKPVEEASTPPPIAPELAKELADSDVPF